MGICVYKLQKIIKAEAPKLFFMQTKLALNLSYKHKAL